jgi:hypothetical protein
MRTIVDIPEEDIRWLDQKASEVGKSRTALVREAVAALRAEADLDWIRRGAGLWKNSDRTEDAVEWQRRERASWSRAGDSDYEEVKAEYPDLFDEQDDREHAMHLAWEAKRAAGRQGHS